MCGSIWNELTWNELTWNRHFYLKGWLQCLFQPEFLEDVFSKIRDRVSFSKQKSVYFTNNKSQTLEKTIQTLKDLYPLVWACSFRKYSEETGSEIVFWCWIVKLINVLEDLSTKYFPVINAWCYNIMQEKDQVFVKSSPAAPPTHSKIFPAGKQLSGQNTCLPCWRP